MKTLVVIAISVVSTVSNAEIITFPSFQLEVEEGWAHTVESGAQMHAEAGSLISIYHPSGNGMLKIRRYTAPGIVGRETLRNMTNVDSSTHLTWQAWGDYSGYQHDYSERGSFYRQWWLTHEMTIILIVYESTTELSDIESDQISKIVNSIKISTL
jgi:hypothetical protein